MRPALQWSTFVRRLFSGELPLALARSSKSSPTDLSEDPLAG